jgi:hypothetical protein
MKRRGDLSATELWRWEAAKLRARADDVADPATREQLLVFADDCEEEARRRDGAEPAGQRRV